MIAKCTCCKKNKEPEAESPSEEISEGNLIRLRKPPKGPPPFISETRKVTTIPPSFHPSSPEMKPKKHMQVRESPKPTPPPEAKIPVTVYSMFDESKQPPKPSVSEVCAPEPSKLPKGILKSSEEKMQAGKSVSISLPEETDEGKPPPDFIPQPSTTHFRSQEMSTITVDGQLQQASEQGVPTSPASGSQQEATSAPTISLTYQKHTPMFARISSPSPNVTTEYSGKVKEEAPETGSPELFPHHPASQDIPPVTNATAPQSSPEKALPRRPGRDASRLPASVPTTSLRSQRRGRLFARASAPPRKTAEEDFREGKEESNFPTAIAFSPEPPAPQGPSPPAPQEPSPTAPQEPSPAAPQEPSPPAPQRPSPAAPQGPSPPAPQGPSPAAPQGPSPPAPQGPSPPAPQGPSPPAPQGPSPPAPQETSPAAPQGPLPPAPQGPLPTAPQGPSPAAPQGPSPAAPQGPSPAAPQKKLHRVHQEPSPAATQEKLPTASISSVLPYSKKKPHKTPEGNFRRKMAYFDEIYSPDLTRERRLYDAPIENYGEGTRAVRSLPTARTAAAPSKPASRPKTAPLPGAKWVHKFI